MLLENTTFMFINVNQYVLKYDVPFKLFDAYNQVFTAYNIIPN